MRTRLGPALGLAFAALALTAGVALGHAELVTSDPPAGGTLTVTPYTLTATFSEEIADSGSSLIVEGPGGAQIATGSVSADDAMSMTAELPALESGEYTVRWTTLTVDDNAVERGTYTFTVATGASASSATPAATPAPDAGGTSGSGNDVLIAVLVAAVMIGGVVVFLVFRSRR